MEGTKWGSIVPLIRVNICSSGKVETIVDIILN